MTWFDDPPAPPPPPPLAAAHTPEGRGLSLARAADRASDSGSPQLGRKAENQYGLVFGMKGYGKTTYARKVYMQRVARGGRCVFIDPKGGETSATGTIVRSVAGMYSVIRAALAERRGFSIVVQLGWGESYDKIWRLLYEVGDMLAVIDEVHLVGKANRIDPDLENLVAMGRNRQVDVITTTQTPPQCHKILRSLSDWVVVFKMPDPRYADQLASEFFHHPQLAPRIMQLPPFHYLRTEKDGRVQRGQVRP